MENSTKMKNVKLIYSLKELNDLEKLIYLIVRDCMLSFGQCRFANEQFGELLNKSRKTISKNISELVKKGYLSIEYNEKKDCATRILKTTRKEVL